MFIPDPGSWFLPIPDPGSKNSNKREGWKIFFCHTFLCSHKFHKIENYFSFEVLKKKIWTNFQRIIELFTQKIVTKPSKIWLWDTGSEIRDPEKTYSGSRIPDPGVKKAPDPGSGSATLKNLSVFGKVKTENEKWKPLKLIFKACPCHFLTTFEKLYKGRIEIRSWILMTLTYGTRRYGSGIEYLAKQWREFYYLLHHENSKLKFI